MRSKSRDGGSSGVSIKDLEGMAPPSSMRPMDALLSGTSNIRTSSAGAGLTMNSNSPRSQKLKGLNTPLGSSGKSGAPGSAGYQSLRGPKSTSTPSGGLTLQEPVFATYGREDTVAPEKVIYIYIYLRPLSHTRMCMYVC
jgi:hypothetical protein